MCTMMGYSGGVYADGLYKTGRNKSIGIKVRTDLRTWLNDVQCFGNETSIDSCTHGIWGKSNCNKTDDVGIKCYSKLIFDFYLRDKTSAFRCTQHNHIN